MAEAFDPLTWTGRVRGRIIVDGGYAAPMGGRAQLRLARTVPKASHGLGDIRRLARCCHVGASFESGIQRDKTDRINNTPGH